MITQDAAAAGPRPILSARAPAKINLSLHILGRRPDGYHELESLVVFSGSGDQLTLEPGDSLGLSVTGPTASAAGADADNLVLKAARALGERVAGLKWGQFHLVKRLPVAAGIGGGSSDAAAALRLLAELNGLPLGRPELLEAARETGADVPVCLEPRARMMRGLGERLGKPAGLPPLAAVLVNPRVALETRQVFGRMALQPGQALAGAIHPAPPAERSGPVLMEWLQGLRNDMEPAARALAPAVGECLAALAATPGNRLARMSGSGSTCFGLFDGCRAASAAAKAIRDAHPAWWVRSTVLR